MNYHSNPSVAELVAQLADAGEHVVLIRPDGTPYSRDWRYGDPPTAQQLVAQLKSWRDAKIRVVRGGQLVDPLVAEPGPAGEKSSESPAGGHQAGPGGDAPPEAEQAGPAPAGEHAGPNLDQGMATAFLRAIWGPHIGQDAYVSLVALNGMATREPLGNGKRSPYDGRRAKFFTVRLCDRTTFESDLADAVNGCARLQLYPATGDCWNTYWTPIITPTGVHRKEALFKGGALLGLWLDGDNAERNAAINGFSAATGVPREALFIINTGSVPSDRFQVFAGGKPMPDQLARNEVLASSLGCDTSVYGRSQLLRCPGFFAEPWKGGVKKTGRVRELVTFDAPAENYSGRVNLPPKKERPPRRPVVPSEKAGEWTAAQQAAFSSYIEAQVDAIGKLPDGDGKRFAAKCAILRKIAMLVEAGLGSVDDVYTVVQACDDPANTNQVNRYAQEVESILADPDDAIGAYGGTDKARTAAEGVIAAIRAGAANAEAIEHHRASAFMRDKNATDWAEVLKAAQEAGEEIEQASPAAGTGPSFEEHAREHGFWKETDGDKAPPWEKTGGGSPFGDGGPGPSQSSEDSKREQDDWKAKLAKAGPIIEAALQETAELLVSNNRGAEKARPGRLRLLRRITVYGQLGAVDPEKFRHIHSSMKELAGAQDAECAPSEHDTGIGRLVVELLANGSQKKFAEAEREAERLARRTAHGKPSEHFHSWGPFTMNEKGLEVEVEKGSGANKEVVLIPVSGAFEILGMSRNQHREGWGLVLRWTDADGIKHRRMVSSAVVHGDAKALCSLLGESGLWINSGAQDLFKKYLGGVRDVAGRVTVAPRTGWLESSDGSRAFVLPHETIQPAGTEEVILDVAVHAHYVVRGTTGVWKDSVARLAKGHVTCVLAIATNLAGPLLGIAQRDMGGGVNMMGDSSKGKSTALCMGASVWGLGSKGGEGSVGSWNNTVNAHEGLAVAHSDTALNLDELGKLKGRGSEAVVYMLADGVGKGAMDRNRKLRDTQTWRVMILSSGEVTIEQKIRELTGGRAHAGQLVRLLDVAAVHNDVTGVFSHSGDFANTAELQTACERAAVTNCGVAGPEFVRQLIEHGVTSEDIDERINAFVKAQSAPWWDGQVVRAAQRLGLIAAAGEMATEYGITGWEPGEATKAGAWALGSWIELRGGVGALEEQQAVELVRKIIETFGDSRFDLLHVGPSQPGGAPDGVSTDDGKHTLIRYGWRNNESGDAREWYVLPESWKDVCTGMNPNYVAKVLLGKGMLRPDKDGKHTKAKVRLGTLGPQRAYVITAKIFDD